MKLQQNPKTNQFTITLPKDVIVGFDWKKGIVLDYRIIGKGEIKIFQKKE